jgi:GTPase SAR1 family protein
VVAFFGGTGVGKSTLLNRLAGHEIARTGVLRPTSREVSIYLYHQLDVEQLSKHLPVDGIRMDRHSNEQMKDILWLDMPDMDSTETANRDIVLEWLPHIDMLLYVVSPERYHDEKGWRMLLSEGGTHAWIFVMNHGDKADSSQLSAFSSQLSNAGFEEPIVFMTCCSGSDGIDEFDILKTTIEKLANRQTIEQLEFRSLVARMKEIKETIDGCIDKMGPEQSLKKIMEHCEMVWIEVVQDLEEGLQWPIQEAAKSLGLVHAEAGATRKPSRSEDASDLQQRQQQINYSTLWDEWAQTRFQDALDKITASAAGSGMPSAPFTKNLARVSEQAPSTLHSQAEQSLRQALANPGNAIQRLFLTIARVCSVLLPLAAIGWVAYEVLDQFHDSTSSGAPYLGINFAIHSTLLITVSWLFPWFLYKKLRPSIEKTARRALEHGTSLGFESIRASLDQVIEELFEQRQQFIQQGCAIKKSCTIPSSRSPIIGHSTLSRILSDPKSTPEE